MINDVIEITNISGQPWESSTCTLNGTHSSPASDVGTGAILRRRLSEFRDATGNTFKGTPESMTIRATIEGQECESVFAFGK
jgi:hypothetical protein